LAAARGERQAASPWTPRSPGTLLHHRTYPRRRPHPLRPRCLPLPWWHRGRDGPFSPYWLCCSSAGSGGITYVER